MELCEDVDYFTKVTLDFLRLWQPRADVFISDFWDCGSSSRRMCSNCCRWRSRRRTRRKSSSSASSGIGSTPRSNRRRRRRKRKWRRRRSRSRSGRTVGATSALFFAVTLLQASCTSFRLDILDSVLNLISFSAILWTTSQTLTGALAVYAPRTGQSFRIFSGEWRVRGHCGRLQSKHGGTFSCLGELRRLG